MDIIKYLYFIGLPVVRTQHSLSGGPVVRTQHLQGSGPGEIRKQNLYFRDDKLRYKVTGQR